MSKNYIQLELGGKKRDILFTVGTLKFIKEVTGEDPMVFSFDTQDYESLINAVRVLVHAGLLTSYARKKEAPDFTKDDISQWVDYDMSEGHIIQLLAAYASSKTIAASGEGGGDTRG